MAGRPRRGVLNQPVVGEARLGALQRPLRAQRRPRPFRRARLRRRAHLALVAAAPEPCVVAGDWAGVGVDGGLELADRPHKLPLRDAAVAVQIEAVEERCGHAGRAMTGEGESTSLAQGGVGGEGSVQRGVQEGWGERARRGAVAAHRGRRRGRC